MSEHFDAVVALSGDFSPDLTAIGPGTRQRMDAALAIVKAEDAPLVVSGNYPFRWRNPSPRPLAHLMKDYAMAQDVPESMIVVQDESLDTIGDALLTKIQVTEPRKWRRLRVVTSDEHAPRSRRIFGHVMGLDYQIETIGPGSTDQVRFQRAQEFVGNVLVRAVLAGTKAGDTEAIKRRLFQIVPGYAEVSVFGRVRGLTAGLLAR